MRILLFCLILAYCTIGVSAQDQSLTLDSGVPKHAGIDAVYAQFSEAYRTLDPAKVGNLYSQDASYLPPDQEILLGRDKIRPTFDSFFEWAKQEGRTMTISFRIVQRKVDKNLGYDVGVYTLRQFKDGKEVASGQGKFVVVAIREKSGKWLFQVDGYNDIKPPKK